MTDESPSAWRITCDPEAFASLAGDKRFWQLVALARLVNTIRFSQAALPSQEDDTPRASRQRFNSFFVTAALLKEGIPLAQRLGSSFRHLPAYQQRILPILQDRAVEQLLAEHLKPLRDEAVAHFLERELGPRLSDHEFDDVCFIRGFGTTSGQVHYQLADMLAMRAFTGATGTREEFLIRATELMQRTTELAIKYLGAADRLIGEALLEMGWRKESDDAGDT